MKRGGICGEMKSSSPVFPTGSEPLRAVSCLSVPAACSPPASAQEQLSEDHIEVKNMSKDGQRHKSGG